MSVTTKRCSCGVEMLMLRHERTHFVAPINPEAFKTPGGIFLPGNIQIDLAAGTYRVLTQKQLAELSSDQRDELLLNHFVTCPKRAKFKRGARA